MTDIVERLRHFSLARSGELHRNADAAMADEAADVIERLQTWREQSQIWEAEARATQDLLFERDVEIERLRIWGPDDLRKLANLEAEIKRLNAVLFKISQLPLDTGLDGPKLYAAVLLAAEVIGHD